MNDIIDVIDGAKLMNGKMDGREDVTIVINGLVTV